MRVYLDEDSPFEIVYFFEFFLCLLNTFKTYQEENIIGLLENRNVAFQVCIANINTTD